MWVDYKLGSCEMDDEDAVYKLIELSISPVSFSLVCSLSITQSGPTAVYTCSCM
jgi:hypothetical protein